MHNKIKYERFSLKDYNDILYLKNKYNIFSFIDSIIFSLILWILISQWIINKNSFDNWRNYLFLYIITCLFSYLISTSLVGIYYTKKIKPHIKIKDIKIPSSEIILDGTLGIMNREFKLLKSFPKSIHPFRSQEELYNFLVKNNNDDVVQILLEIGDIHQNKFDNIYKFDFNTFEQFKQIMDNEFHICYIEADKRQRHLKTNIIVTILILIFFIFVSILKTSTSVDKIFYILIIIFFGIKELLLIINYIFEKRLYPLIFHEYPKNLRKKYQSNNK